MSAFTFRPQVEQLDDRRLPSANALIAIDSVGVVEGGGGRTALVFHVTLSTPSSREVSVNFKTANGTATGGSDYVAVSGTLHFARGETAKTITVLVNGDTDYEGNEQFAVNLSGASGAKIAVAQGVGTIINDDPYPYEVPPGWYIDPISGMLIPPQPPPGCSPDDPDYPNC